MPTPAKAKTVVVGAALATGVLTTVTATVEHGPIPAARSMIGVTVAAVFLLALSDGAPSVAVGFAVLMLTAALTNSINGLKAIAHAVGG